MKKLFILFGLLYVIALAGCGGGGGGNSEPSTSPVPALKELEEDYPTVKADYDSIRNSFASAINDRTENNVNTEITKLMEVFSDDFSEDGIGKEALKTKLINKITDTSNIIATYTVTPVIFTSVVDSSRGTKINSDGTLSVATQLYVTGRTSGGEGPRFTYNQVFDIRLRNEGTPENPDWKIISGFPTTSSKF